MTGDKAGTMGPRIEESTGERNGSRAMWNNDKARFDERTAEMTGIIRSRSSKMLKKGSGDGAIRVEN